MNDTKIQGLIESIDRYAVNPETEDFWMKIVDCGEYNITGKGVYSPTAERNKHIYNEFLSDGFYSNYPNLDEHFEEIWESYLVRQYYNAIFEIGAIPWGGKASDFIVVVDSMEGAINKFDLEHCLHFHYNVSESAIKASNVPEDKYQQALRRLYIGYLQGALEEVERKQPIKVLWESQLNDYLLKCTSLGGVVAKPVIGPNGGVRRPLPWTEWQAMLNAIGGLSSRCPSRVINTKTKMYSDIKGLYNRNNREMGYASIDEFLDAYGFSKK